VLSFACVLATSTLIAQRGPAPDPLVKENVTVKLGPHSYVIPDGNVGLVPNVGIVVGSRATLVIDPGLDAFLRAKFPDAKVTCSATPEYAGTIERQASTIGRRRAQSMSVYCGRRWVWPKPVPYCSPTSNCK
jgi:hypothetical protein